MDKAEAFGELADRLTVLAGFCELMLDETYGKMPASQREVLENVFQAARGAQQILREAQGGDPNPPPQP